MNVLKQTRSGSAGPALFAVVLIGHWLAASSHGQAAPGEFSECLGRIEESSSGHSVSFADLARHVGSADYVLFGERHGVRDQAIASSCVLSAMAKDERPVALVMEMLSRDDDDLIAAYRINRPETPAGLGGKLEWWTRGWPAFDNWLPLIERAFSLRIPLLGGDLSSKEKQQGKLTPQEEAFARGQFGPSYKSIRASWNRAMLAAHCDLISNEEAALKADNQIRRDLSMAEVAEQARASDRRVLLNVGRGHSRKDRALYQKLLNADAFVISIGAFAEGESINGEERNLYDYVWVVGQADLEDPCKFNRSANLSGERTAR